MLRISLAFLSFSRKNTSISQVHTEFEPSVYSFVFFTHILKKNISSSGRKGYPCFTLVKFGCARKDKARKHPKLHKETLTFLRNHFAPMLEKFKTQTGMKLELS